MKPLPDHAKLSDQAENRSTITILLIGLLFIGFVAESPLEADPGLYNGLWRSVFVVFAPFVTSVPGISLQPWQMLLIALVPFCLGASDMTRRHARELDRAILVCIACIAVTFLWGRLHGGSAYFAYYQLWHFMLALLLAYLLMSAVRTQRDLVSLGKLVVLVAMIRATFCIYVYWAYVKGLTRHIEYITDHDDSMLWVVAILIVFVWALFRARTGPWILASLLAPCMLYAIVLNNRRIAWVELGLAMLLTYLLLGAGPLRKRINRWAMAAIPVVVVYIVVGWGSDSAVFAPIHALRTTGSNTDGSSLTRLEEDRNLLRTMKEIGNPIVGLGWGRPHIKYESRWSIYSPDWILYLYTPHNSLLGMAVFSGLVGVIGIWGVVATGAYLASRGYGGSTDLVPRTAGIVALGSLAVYSAHCYGDIGFESFKGALIFGMALGTAGKVAVWSEVRHSAETVKSRAESGRAAPQRRFAYGKGAPARRRPLAGSEVADEPSRAPMRRPWR